MPLRQVELYLNQTPGSMFWAYDPRAVFRCAYRGQLDLPAHDQRALEQVFALFNRDVRPDGYSDRSLSVGDVVTLDGIESWAVDGIGFSPLLKAHSGDPIIGYEEWSGPDEALPDPWPPFGGGPT